MRGACRRSTTWFRCRWICGRRSTRTYGWNRGWRGCSAALEYSRAGLRKATRPRLAQIVERRKDLLPALPVILGLVVGQSGMSQPDFGAAALRLELHAHYGLETVGRLGHPGLLEETRALQAGEPPVMGPALALPLHFGVPEAVDLRVHDQARGLEPAFHVRGIGPGEPGEPDPGNHRALRVSSYAARWSKGSASRRDDARRAPDLTRTGAAPARCRSKGPPSTARRASPGALRAGRPLPGTRTSRPLPRVRWRLAANGARRATQPGSMRSRASGCAPAPAIPPRRRPLEALLHSVQEVAWRKSHTDRRSGWSASRGRCGTRGFPWSRRR